MEVIGFIACRFIASRQVGTRYKTEQGYWLFSSLSFWALQSFSPGTLPWGVIGFRGAWRSALWCDSGPDLLLCRAGRTGARPGLLHQGWITGYWSCPISSYFYVFDKHKRVSHHLWLCFSGCAVPCELCPSGWGLRGTSSHSSRDFENWRPSASSCGWGGCSRSKSSIVTHHADTFW